MGTGAASTVTIELTQGMTTIDIEDADLAQFGWYALRSPNSDRYYAVRHITTGYKKQGLLLLHKVIFERFATLLPGQVIDHKDNNPLNNRRSNLRIASHSQNMQNRKRHKNNTSGYKGVTWHKGKGKWRAAITVNKRKVHLGYFVNLEDAAAAYHTASEQLHREFSRTE